MPLFEAVRMALRTIVTQKLKSFFSLIGVLIGVTFLIAVVSIVQGMNVYMEDQFANRLIGLNTFTLRRQPGINTGNVTDDMWRAWQRRPRITYGDADEVAAKITTPVTMAKWCSDRMTLTYNGKMAKDIELMGTEPSYFTIKNVDIAVGRAFTTQETKAGLPILVLGDLVAEKLFPGLDPVGKEVTILGLPYRVIGVAAKRGNLFGFSLDKFAVMPFMAPARRYICPINVLDELQIKAANPTQMLAAMGEVESIMRIRRHLRPGQENNFDLQNATGALEGWKGISHFLFLALPGLVSISLVVGGIVIMNIMLMAVAERTREIGIRKALGAKRRDILAQFVVESATLSTVGAAFGIGTGILLAFVVRALSPLPAAVAPWSVFLGVGLGIAVGIIAGVYPAYRASKLDPIAALRQE
ncbi:MAG TPA: ABC transporter permease [Gemmatimonadales bacterium]|nr:ABC transporter permease [Gemmatimonadales bacterium]